MALRTALLMTATVSLLGTGCEVVSVSANLDHCTYNDGDRYCAGLDPTRPYCTQGDDSCNLGGFTGCVADVTPECHAPCGVLPEDECMAGGSSGSDTGTASGTDSQTGTDSDSDSTSTGPMPCVGNEDCPDAAAPFCEPDSGECVRCDGLDDGDAACAGVDPLIPLCVDGACVECTAQDPLVCDDQLLLCDAETNACVSCTAHEQCAAGACDVSEGRCFDPENVLHVGMGQPYMSITAALDDVGAMMLDPAVLVLHEGASFDETATVSAGTLAIVAADGDQPQWVNTSVMAPTLTVTGMQTRVYLHQLRLAQNGNDIGLVLDDGAWVDARRSQIVQNAGGGVLAQNGAELTLRNCFVGDGNTNSTDAITVNGATLTMLYTTVGAAANTGMPARALFCDGGGQADVRNSILVSFDPGPEVECPGLTIADSATEAELGMLSGTWFDNYGAGDFHLTMSAPIAAATAAQWQLGDPTTDIDGDLRPTMDGTPDYAGADIPPP